MAHQKKFPALQTLDFGRLDAREEARVSPELLVGGYFDHQSAAYRVEMRDAWVLVGPKGAGKSAAIEHLTLLWEGNPEKFLKRWDLGNFPVADITSLQVGAELGPTSTKAAWTFLLLLRVFESMVSDELASYPADVLKLKSDLVRHGLINGPDLRTKFVDWKSATFKFNILAFGMEGGVADSGATALQVIEILRRAISAISTNSQHLLTLDGLDAFFAQTNEHLESLAALLDATADVDHFLAETGNRVHVVLAIRSDMFAQLPSTDSAKLGDHAVELDWSRSGVGGGNELWDLVSRKARVSVPKSFEGLRLGDIRKAYLDTPIGVGPYTALPDLLLSHTRLLPRDLIALMTELKSLHKGSGQVRETTAREAIRRYSETYFVREVNNGLSRVLPTNSALKVALFTDALRALPSRRFRAGDLESELAGGLDQPELRTLLKQLFVIGAVGVRTKSGGEWHTNFAYRRTAGGGFSFVSEYVLHNSLVVGWNLQW